jgi:hypothetical protein
MFKVLRGASGSCISIAIGPQLIGKEYDDAARGRADRVEIVGKDDVAVMASPATETEHARWYVGDRLMVLREMIANAWPQKPKNLDTFLTLIYGES